MTKEEKRKRIGRPTIEHKDLRVTKTFRFRRSTVEVMIEKGITSRHLEEIILTMAPPILPLK